MEEKGIEIIGSATKVLIKLLKGSINDTVPKMKPEKIKSISRLNVSKT